MKELIMVVDDDELARSGLMAALEGEGYGVIGASSGEDAMRHLAHRRVDLLLCDMVMSGASGLDVLKFVRAKWPETIVIMITGHATIGNALDALKAGASDYIQKPASPDEVSHRIRSALEARHLRENLNAERHRAESRRKEVNEHLVRAERMASVGRLAEGAANELSQILAPLAGLVSALKEKGAGLAKLLPGIEEMEAIARKAGAVLQDLRTIGRGKPPEKQGLRMHVLIEQFLKSDELEELQLANPSVRLEFNVSGELPEIRGSEAQMKQVLQNLLTNAFEVSPQDRAVVRVTAVCERVDRAVGRYGSGGPGNYVILRVEDQGPPLSEEDLERILEPFYIQQNMKRRQLSGLGMTLVHRVLEDHHGFLDISAGAESGNVYTVYLPALTTARETAAQTHSDFSGKETVLVVDDYDAQRELAAKLLRGVGYDVLTAADGHEAIKIFERAQSEGKTIHVALLDLILGDELDGVEVYKKLLEISPGQKAIIVTGFADLARIVEARQLGIRHVVQKPYALDSMGKAIRAELDG